ncbi:GumC family protein [Neoroseomonas soli]|uniref:Polysaccharide chain length determinant N-terminal domain-containing protein n=1 Tax=Neoroseomonas soli TaxID=1081025 RepID=A0A9X9WUV5_9PROT|nr:hypothetical protein [Neoroseomonas soli]MBR0670934.1 hypothetical protein [Neoroseomonas soli]
MEGGGTTVIGRPPKTTWLPSDLLGILALARRYWVLALGCGFAGAVALLAAAVLIGGPSYVVSAKIMVNLGPEMVGSPLLATLQGTPAAPAMLRPEDSTTGVEIFNNPRLIRETVESLGPDFFADEPPGTLLQRVKHAGRQAIRAVQGALREATIALGLRPRITETERMTLAIGAALRVEPVRRTDIIDVTLAFPDPRAGELILGRFIDLALAGHVRAYRLPGVTEFLRDALAERRAELRAAEDRLLALRTRRENPVWSAAEQRPVLIRSEAELQQQLRQEHTAIAATEAEIGRAEAALAGLPDEIELGRVRSRNAETDALRGRLVQLRLDRVAQEARYGENSPEINDIRRQTEALVALLGSEEPYRIDQITTGINQLHQSLDRDLVGKRILLEGQRGRARQLEAEIARLRGQMGEMEAAAVEIAVLEQTVARLTRAIELYQNGYENARIAETMSAVRLSGLRVVMPPTAEIIPSSPSIRKIGMLGFAAGLMMALGLILFREYRAAMGPPDGGGAQTVRGEAA